MVLAPSGKRTAKGDCKTRRRRVALPESKHLVICNMEISGTCEGRDVLSWWELIGVAEIAATTIYVCIIWYP